MFNRLPDPEGYKLPRLAQMRPQIGVEVHRLQALTLPQLATEVGDTGTCGGVSGLAGICFLPYTS